MKEISQRKQDHIQAILQDPQIDRESTEFDTLKLSHRALPELDFDQICLKTQFLDHTLSFPLLISSMTGGDGENLVAINQHLAEAAEDCQVAMAVGSQRAMIHDPNANKSFAIRQFAPTVPLIANMGAVQLNYNFGFSQAQRMIDSLEANAIYLHLNALQEVIQPEGNRNFAHLIDKIVQLKDQLSVPVILKEVGCGFSLPDLVRIQDAGIEWVDVAGRGGSSWSRIESHRAENSSSQQLGLLFQDWGISTLQSLRYAQSLKPGMQIIASGGIRNGIDMVKSVIMGAQICGIAAPLLAPAMTSTALVVETIRQYQQEFRTAQFLLGCGNSQQLFANHELLVTP